MKTKMLEPNEKLQTLFNAYARKAVSERPGPDTETSSKPEPRNHVWASQLRDCARQMYYDLTAWHKLPGFDAEVIARLDRGRNRERDIGIELTRVGQYADPPFEWVGQQEYFTLNGQGTERVITGKLDGKVQWADGERWPAEIKSWHPNLTAALNVFEDVLAHPYARRAGYQLLTYLFGTNSRRGLLVLDTPGLPKFLRVDLFDHLETVEQLLSRAEDVVTRVRQNLDPPPHTERLEECSRCPFYTVTCDPPQKPDEAGGLAILTASDTEELIATMLENEAAAQAYNSARKTLAQRHRGVQAAICGPFGWSGKWARRSKLKLPQDGPERKEYDALQARLEKTKTAQRLAELREKFTATDPKGAFSFQVFRLDATPESKLAKDTVAG